MAQVVPKHGWRFTPSDEPELLPESGQRAHRQMQEAAREVVRRVQGDLGRRRL